MLGFFLREKKPRKASTEGRLYKKKEIHFEEAVKEDEICNVVDETEEKKKLSIQSADASLEIEKIDEKFHLNGDELIIEQNLLTKNDSTEEIIKEKPRVASVSSHGSQSKRSSKRSSSLLSSSSSSSSSLSSSSSSSSSNNPLQICEIENGEVFPEKSVEDAKETTDLKKESHDYDDQTLTFDEKNAKKNVENRPSLIEDQNLSTRDPPQTENTVLVEPTTTSNSFDSGGITLSLRIEHDSSGPTLRLNSRKYSRQQSKLTETSSESEDKYSASENGFDDNIQVIRRYDVQADPRTRHERKTTRENGNQFLIDDPDFLDKNDDHDDDSNDYETEDEMNCEDETIAGIVNVTSGEKLTICQAVKNGLIPRKTALLLLEAQAATGSIVNPRNGVKLSVTDAVSLGVIDEEYKNKLIAAEGAFYGYLDPRTGESICLSMAITRKIFPKGQGFRLLEAQMATGGLIDPWTGLRYPLKSAVSKGLIGRKAASILKTRKKQTAFFDPTTHNKLGYSDLLNKCTRDLDTGLKFLYIEEKPKRIENKYQPDLLTFRTAFRKKVTLQDLIDADIVEDATVEAFQSGRITQVELLDILHPYLVGEDPIAGILNKTTNKVRTISQAAQEGILRRGTALELLEAQAATGSIIDPFSGKKLSLSRALSSGLVDSQYSSQLKRAEQAVSGYTEPGTKRIISLFEAMKKGIVIESHGIRMLEAQIATGGVIDPEGGFRIPINAALEKGLFDDRMAQILMSTNHDMKGYYDPNSGDNLTYGELMRRCVRNKKKYGNMLLLPIYDQSPMATGLQSLKLSSETREIWK